MAMVPRREAADRGFFALMFSTSAEEVPIGGYTSTNLFIGGSILILAPSRMPTGILTDLWNIFSEKSSVVIIVVSTKP